MPFELFHHRDRAASTPAKGPGSGLSSAAPPNAAGSAVSATVGVTIDAFTEERRISARVQLTGRLSDALNRRERLPVFGVRTAPLAAPDQLDDAPDVRELDPYELVVVAAGPDSQPALTADQRAAIRSRKLRYAVCCELAGASVCGVVHLHPGVDPSQLVEHRPELFVPLTDAVVRVGGTVVDEPQFDVALVNRAYLRAVVPIDASALDLAAVPADDAGRGPVAVPVHATPDATPSTAHAQPPSRPA
jgi:hypothetical protein